MESWPREKLVIEAALSCCAVASEASAAAWEQSAVVTMWGEASANSALSLLVGICFHLMGFFQNMSHLETG